MALTKEHVRIISKHPLGSTFDQIRDRLRDARRPREGAGNEEEDNPNPQDVEAILLTLIGSTAAFNLHGPNDGNGGHIAVRLLSVLPLFRNGEVKPALFRDLTHCIADGKSDIEIWEAVFDIVESLGADSAIPLPQPPTFFLPTTFQGTPVKSSSSRFVDSETWEIVERELFYEIKDCTFRNVGGFWEKFFNVDGATQTAAMVKTLMTAHDGNRWKDFPSIPDEKPVWDWLKSLEHQYLCGSPHKLHTTASANQFKERKGQMDIFYQAPTTRPDATFEYKNVLVAGEQKKSYDTGRFKADFLQLSRHVRGIFADQPTRRFVHAFLLCGSVMELWVFDRSGPYSSGTFDIHKEPEKFARALVGYANMDEDAMGLDTFTERAGGHRYVSLDDTRGEQRRIRLEKAMVRQQAIVCRGTTCYLTRNLHVAKFAWASDKRKLEVEQLKRAEERGVKGVARVIGHRRITSIASIRDGLQFPTRHRFRGEPVRFEHGPGIKRKSSWSSQAPDSVTERKRRRFGSTQSPRIVTEDKVKASTSKPEPSLDATSDDPWENRIHT